MDSPNIAVIDIPPEDQEILPPDGNHPPPGAVAKSAAPLPSEAFDPDTLRPEAHALGNMVGRSLPMQHLFSRVRCTAPHFRLACIEGEAGSGKLLLAHTLHSIGPASAGPFAPFIAADFLADPQNLWRQARNGLLYLSHIDEISPEMQLRLREFLERAAHERIRLHSPDGPRQLVVGSSQPLRRISAAGSFRSDLAAHLTAIRFPLPPLRDRRDDIPLLAALFLRRWTRLHRPLRGFAPGTLTRLHAHDWPGNVRELESVLTSAALECPGQWIRPIDIPPLDWRPNPAAAASPVPPDSSDDPNLDRAILRHVTRVLARANGNKVRAAHLLGISRSTLYRLLDPTHFPPAPGSSESSER